MNRRRFLKTATLASASLASVGFSFGPAINFKFEPEKPLIPAPPDPSLWPAFRQQLTSWREQMRRKLNYSDALYTREDFRWVRSDFACCFLMLFDQVFYAPKSGRYTVKEFLDKARHEFGGFDSLVLWHAYPRIGFDERNQFDFYRDAPGGLAGLRAVVAQLHREGLKVFIDYNPWDTATRREGKDDIDALAEMVGALQVDGIFLDTMDHGAASFRAKLDAVRKGVVLEGEDALPLEHVSDHHLSWAQWFADSVAPGVLRNKWFERRHLQHQIRRWDHDHTAELHTAWMNGSGMMIWENVFGTWNGWCPRDRSILRSMLSIQRRFVTLLSGENWTPLVPTQNPRVYASLWESPGIRLWTLVNRSVQREQGAWLQIELRPGERVFDLVAGQEIHPSKTTPSANTWGGVLSPRGIGCLVAAATRALGNDFKAFLKIQRALAERADWDSTPPLLHTALNPVQLVRRAPSGVVPKDMAAIPAATVRMRTEFRTRECGFYESTDPEFVPNGPRLNSSRAFERTVVLRSYAIDLAPVTNGQFAEFINSSAYRPRQPENFLKHWKEGAPPPGREDHPVVYVDLDDARAYCKWAHKRLPTEEEWQYAAQGSDGRKYPWGNEMLSGHCNEGAAGGTTSVRAFPLGRSPFGLYDLCGNVWEWTESERSDGRTRFCVIRGGSFYRVRGSEWYADGGPQPCNFAAKFLLTWPGLDRCATIGFRCATELG